MPLKQPAGPGVVLFQTRLTFSTNIQCSPIADTEIVGVSVTITPSDGSNPVTRTLTGPETIKFDGTVDATVTVEATMLDTVAGMSGLADRVFTTSTLLNATTTDVFTRLPFDIRKTHWTADESLVALLDIPATDVDLGADRPQFVLRVEAQNHSFRAGTALTVYLPATVGTEIQARGAILPFSGQAIEDLPISIIGPGRWHAAATSFVQD